jgi:hypothetical protein
MLPLRSAQSGDLNLIHIFDVCSQAGWELVKADKSALQPSVIFDSSRELAIPRSL